MINSGSADPMDRSSWTYSAKDFLIWLVERARQWSDSAHTKSRWAATCAAHFGRVPEAPEEMSMQELEVTLLMLGDGDVPEVRAKTYAADD